MRTEIICGEIINGDYCIINTKMSVCLIVCSYTFFSANFKAIWIRNFKYYILSSFLLNLAATPYRRVIMCASWLRLCKFNKIEVLFFWYTESELYYYLLYSPTPVAIQASHVFNTSYKSKRGHFVKYAEWQSRSDCYAAPTRRSRLFENKGGQKVVLNIPNVVCISLITVH